MSASWFSHKASIGAWPRVWPEDNNPISSMTAIDKVHHSHLAWTAALAKIRAEMVARNVHPSRTIVLMPYAQLMNEGRKAWRQCYGEASFTPRFETTQNWATTIGASELDAHDIRRDIAVDLLTAGSLLTRAGLTDYRELLAQRLVEAAWSLAGSAAAVSAENRAAWGASLKEELSAGLDAPTLALEVALGRIALAWATTSNYVTDSLFAQRPELLVALDGFQADPLSHALSLAAGERGLSFAFNTSAQSQKSAAPSGIVKLYKSIDTNDEAGAAASCVLNHVKQGRGPVALVAVDRLLTRRVRAMLGERGVQVRDETGWKLSTTRAAASLMGLLRACRWDASTDDVLDWLKNAPGFDVQALAEAESAWRKQRVREWYGALQALPDAALRAQELVAQVNGIRQTLLHKRCLQEWLNGIRAALQKCGQWQRLVADPAGRAVVRALRLDDRGDGGDAEFVGFSILMSLNEFSNWVTQVLEDANFSLKHPLQEQVVILPMSQLLGRHFASVVMPGCDEGSLPLVVEPGGPWTARQRQLLRLHSRADLANSTRNVWSHVLQFPHVDLLWRSSEAGERVMPSPLIQSLIQRPHPHFLQSAAQDSRVMRTLSPVPEHMPRPSAAKLPVRRLSSTGYEDLRRCPYRFFALRQLKLQEYDELDTGPSKRDFGTWLHCLLQRFHDDLKVTPLADFAARELAIDAAADFATVKLKLSQSEFLPFAASWPRVRMGYLRWLAKHEGTGAAFQGGELWREMLLGDQDFGGLTLVGKIDRIDELPDKTLLVLDYKTESATVTAQRIKPSTEDSQLAFYAALLPDDTLAGAYVNVGEKDGTKTYSHPDIVGMRDQLIEGILHDMSRIRAGARLPALGEGKACDFCAARGLCRKDFWSAE